MIKRWRVDIEYRQGFDLNSLPLIQNLLSDLIQTLTTTKKLKVKQKKIEYHNPRRRIVMKIYKE